MQDGARFMRGGAGYSLASLPTPATPGPRPAPGEPTDFKVELNNDGSTNLTWSCNNSGNAGTQYLVWRKLDAEDGVERARRDRQAQVRRRDHPRGHEERDLQDQGHPHDRRRAVGDVHRQLSRRHRRRRDRVGEDRRVRRRAARVYS